MERFRGKVALVTGASRGIGRAIALRLAAEGADLALNFLANRALAEEVAGEIRSSGRRAEVIQADVRDNGSVAAMIAAAAEALGGIDVWVNNAGVEFEEPIEEIQEETAP